MTVSIMGPLREAKVIVLIFQRVLRCVFFAHSRKVQPTIAVYFPLTPLGLPKSGFRRVSQ